MRLAIVRLFLLTFTLSPAVLHSSGPGNGRPYWSQWNLEVYSHYCSLESKHNNDSPPFYPDLAVSFRVETKNTTHPASSRVGEVSFVIQTYLPSVPKKNTPLNRVARISVDDIELVRTDQGHHEDILRTFGIFGDEADTLFDAFRNYKYTDEIYMQLTLENGEVVNPRLFLQHHFDTRARMLLVCTDPELVHFP